MIIVIRSPGWRELCAMMWPGWSVPANWGWRRMVGCLRSVWTSNLVSRRGCIFMLVAAEHQARRPTRVREKYCEASQSPVLAPAPASPPASAGTLLPSLSRTPSQPHGLTRLTRLPGCRHTNNLSLNLAPPTFPGLYNLPLLIPAKL